PDLEEVAATATADKIRRGARESVDLIRLRAPEVDAETRSTAARDLGDMHSARGGAALKELLAAMDQAAAAGNPPDAALRDVYRDSLQRIDRYQHAVRGFDYL